MVTGPRTEVVDQLLVALASGDAGVVFEVMARCDPTHAEIVAAESLLRLDEWLDRRWVRST
jgi:hypothetical protein